MGTLEFPGAQNDDDGFNVDLQPVSALTPLPHTLTTDSGRARVQSCELYLSIQYDIAGFARLACDLGHSGTCGTGFGTFHVRVPTKAHSIQTCHCLERRDSHPQRNDWCHNHCEDGALAVRLSYH
jgi:hypothetical protein